METRKTPAEERFEESSRDAFAGPGEECARDDFTSFPLDDSGSKGELGGFLEASPRRGGRK